MDINAIAQTVAKMFPNAKVSEAITQAQQMTQGTQNDLMSARNKAHELGINAGFVNNIYSQFGNSYQARALCKILGTSPEALRDDALNLVGDTGKPTQSAQKPHTTKFPRLK